MNLPKNIYCIQGRKFAPTTAIGKFNYDRP